MSSRALASQRSKRTNTQSSNAQHSNSQVSSNNATNANTNANNNYNSRKELSIPQAFSLLNSRVSNLEKRIFDDEDEVSPSTNSSANMSTNNSNMKEQILNDIKKEVNFNISQDVLNDYNQRIQQLEESSNNNIANPFKTNEPIISNEEIELLKLANTENNKKIYSIEQENTILTETVAHLKDTIINLQNFTLEINNNVLLHINALRNNPLSFLDEISNQAGISHIEDSDSEINDIEHTLHIDENDHNSVNPDEIVVVNEEDQIIHEKDEEVSITEVTTSLIENNENNDTSETVLNNTPVYNLSSDNNTDNSDNSVTRNESIKNENMGTNPDDTIAYY
jgi:hypothetical protein